MQNTFERRHVTEAQQATKMANLTSLSKSGRRIYTAVEHDRYKIKNVLGLYDPYSNELIYPDDRK